jgi:hypothetical protein
MKKLILLLVLVFVASSSAVTVITTPEELQGIVSDLTGDYILGNDIDMTGFAWQGIGHSQQVPFTGTFDGDFHVINGLTAHDDVNSDPYKNASLFGIVGAGGVVKNLGMTNVNVSAGWYCAAMVGDLRGEMSKCWVEGGTVTLAAVGGNGGTLIGLVRNTGVVTDCYSTAELIILPGEFNQYKGVFTGGIAGTVTNCYFAGTITGDGATELTGTHIPFTGYITEPIQVTSCYYDKDLVGIEEAGGLSLGRTTAEMMTQANFVGWDFENTWFIDEGQTYPKLVPIVVDPTFPTVDAGEDMLTWSGEPVELDPNVVNNDPCEPQAPLTYLWTANPATGVVFDPGAEVEDPNVTITKPATVTTTVSITNPGFESPVLADGDYTYDFTNCPGWSNVDVSTIGGVWNPGLPGTSFPGYGGNAPEGQNIAYVNSSGIKQVLTKKTFAADTTYTLTVKVGNTEGFDWTGYKVQLLAGETVLAEDDNTVAIATGTFKTSTVTYTYDSGDSALLGQALQIRLFCLGSGGEADFDDVQLTAEAPAPVPYVVTLTLAVNNEDSGRPDVKDTMTIDVYDDACQMARLGEGKAADNPGDFDGDCITDANDLDELAAEWLTGDALTVPIIKP